MSSAEIFAVGDVYLDRSSPDAPWGDLGPEMTRADATLCNYEAPISDRGAVARGRAVPLRTPTHLLGPIKAGWSAVSLAQNHALDWGETAALDTLDLCATAGLPTTGLGRDIDHAWRPAHIDVNGIPVSVLAIACAFPRSFAASADRCGVAAVHVDSHVVVGEDEMEHPGLPPTVLTSCRPNDLERARAAVSHEVNEGRQVFVYVHWGAPGVSALLDYQIELGHLLADAGATAVLGTHAHLLQAVEVYRSVPVLYGMSHVVFDLDGILTRWPFQAATYGARIDLDPTGVRQLSLVPFEFDEQAGQSTVVRSRRDDVYRILQRLSAPLGTNITWDADEAQIRVELP